MVPQKMSLYFASTFKKQQNYTGLPVLFNIMLNYGDFVVKSSKFNAIFHTDQTKFGRLYSCDFKHL